MIFKKEVEIKRSNPFNNKDVSGYDEECFEKWFLMGICVYSKKEKYLHTDEFKKTTS